MKSLVRWRPMEEMVPGNFWRSFGDEDFDAVMERLMGSMDEKTMAWMPKIEAYRKNGSYVVKADLPGVKPKDIHVAVDNGCLVIRGERQKQKEVKRRKAQRNDVYYGRFERAMAIPDGLKVEKMKAEYHDGILEIRAPMGKEPSSKVIKVEARKGA